MTLFTFEQDLIEFVRESNLIEGIDRSPTPDEIRAHIMFLDTPITVESLKAFVTTVQPGAALRQHELMDVRVGNYTPLAGGRRITTLLELLLTASLSTYERHLEYEKLHPFTDGNGRSGRALWLRDMGGPAKVPLGFLHTFYYQTLAAKDL